VELGQRFELTRGHSTSSYGLPVLVDRETGEAIGKADLVEVGGKLFSGAEIMFELEQGEAKEE